ncbi:MULTISPECIES: hypothetical protein [unclassified Ornithinimicrobium]
MLPRVEMVVALDDPRWLSLRGWERQPDGVPVLRLTRPRRLDEALRQLEA